MKAIENNLKPGILSETLSQIKIPPPFVMVCFPGFPGLAVKKILDKIRLTRT